MGQGKYQLGEFEEIVLLIIVVLFKEIIFITMIVL
jgi:hypothetical protein